MDESRIVPVGPRVASTGAARMPPAWLRALFIVAVMVRNVLASGLVAFAAAFCTSRGNVLSAKPSRDQSRVEFLAATMLWTQMFAFVTVLVAFSMRLSRAKIPSAQSATGARRSILHWLVRMLEYTVVAYIVAAGTLLGIVYASHHVVPTRLGRYKFEYYVEMLVNHMFFSVCDARARYLYRRDTIAGRRKSLTSTAQHRPPTWRRLAVRALIQALPTLVAVVVASVYVQVVSQWKFSTPREINVFVAGSLVVKLVTQEIAQHYLLARDNTQLLKMSMLVSVPTVIIDTQVRVVILTVASVQSSLMGSYVLALAEIALRSIKVMLIRFAIQRKRRQVLATGAAISQFTEWRHQRLSYHTAETHADMYAEYIAIVCSAAITVFWSHNPQYMVNFQTTATTSIRATLALQTGIEVLVDYVSCVVEIHYGAVVDKDRHGFGAFLGVLSLLLVILNMNISAMLYARTE